MQTFKDALGREWSIEFTYLDIKRIRMNFGINLMGYLDQEANLLDRLSDVVLMVDLISDQLTEQIRSRGLGEREFALGLVNEGFERARDCFLRALAFFSPSREGRLLLQMLDQFEALQEKGFQKVEEAIPKIVEKCNQEIDSRLIKLNG